MNYSPKQYEWGSDDEITEVPTGDEPTEEHLKIDWPEPKPLTDLDPIVDGGF